MIILDLKINPDLLNPNFNGYKLSLDPIGVCKINLPANVDQTFPSEEQYSFLYHKLFSLHNHLHQNPYSSDEYGKVYFVDEKWRVYENVVNPNNHTLESAREVFEIPANEHRIPGHWNVCLKFVSETMCVIADGAGTLHVVNTQNVPWMMEYSSEVLGKGSIFSILDSVLCETPGGKILHACLLSVEEVSPDQSTNSNPDIEPSKSRSSDQESTGSKLVNVVNWISLHQTEDGWCLKRQRQIHVPGSIHYFALNKSGSALYLIADRKFTFVSDSEKQIIVPPADSNSADAKKEPEYFWQQTDEEVKLWFPMSGEVSKGDVNISVTNSDLRITCRDKDLLRGNTVQLIDANLTTWNLEKEKLEVVLQKQSPIRWTPGVVLGDEKGEEILDPKLVEEVHQRLAHLCSDSETVPDDSKDPGHLFNIQQLEECDSLASEHKALVRIDGEIHTGTHLMTLGGAQILLSAPLSHGPGATIPALCLRHDVDGALLQIEEDGESGAVSVVHEGTLQAFGYVQASKAGKKFSTCAPDMSYGVICESSRHVFIYVQQSRVCSELRNRVTGRHVPSVSKQHVVTLSRNDEEVLGVAPARGCLYVLTSEQLYMIKLET